MRKRTKRRNKAVATLLLLMLGGALALPYVAAVIAEANEAAQPAEAEQETGLEMRAETKAEPEKQPASEAEPEYGPETQANDAPEKESVESIAQQPVYLLSVESAQEPSKEVDNTPAADPLPALTEEPTAEPTAEPDTGSAVEPTQEPTSAPTAEPSPSPTPIVPAGKYAITITPPAKWQTGKATATVSIVDQNGTGWAHIKIVLAAPSAWTTIVDDDSQAKEYAVSVSENSTLYVSITDHAGNVQAKSEAIACFDGKPPTVRAGVSGEMICIEASDEISGVEAVYINGHRLTYSGSTLDAKIRDFADGKETIAVQAADRAGNFSETAYLKNPFYGQAQATARPTATPKPTKKPSSGGSASRATPVPVSTATPIPVRTPETTAAPVSTISPITAAAPTAVVPTISEGMLENIAEKVLESLIAAPQDGSAFSMNGNMKTLDLLYSKATNKQFIAVQTKKGNTYYIVIDYDKPLDADGDLYETYFLNLVDECDLLAMLDEKALATPEPTATPQPTATPTPTPTPTPTAAPAPQTESLDDTPMATMALLLLLALGGGGAAAVFALRKKEKAGRVPDIDDLEFDDDDDNGDDPA